MFKIGDKVKVVRNLREGVWVWRDEEMPIGTLGVVDGVDENEEFERVYVTSNSGEDWWFHEDELEEIKE